MKRSSRKKWIATLSILALAAFTTGCPDNVRQATECARQFGPELLNANRLTVTELPGAFVSDFSIQVDGREIAVMRGEAMTMALNYTLVDVCGNTWARAEQDITPGTNHVRIRDGRDQPIGEFSENHFESMVSSETRYDVMNPGGQVVASSGRFDFFSSTFTLRDPQNHDIATLERPASQYLAVVPDEWTLHIRDRARLSRLTDLRVFLFMAAFKTAADTD